MKSKKVSESYSQSSELVLPNDTNNLGKLMGGKLLHWMDIIAAISAQRATNRTVVTVAVDFVEFKASIPLGAVVVSAVRQMLHIMRFHRRRYLLQLCGPKYQW